jgi:hypothetical protein
MKYSIPSYKKAIKVIDSCETEEQCNVARNFVNNFFKFHSKEKVHPKVGFRQYVTDDFIGEMYERLKRKLYIKELDIQG